MSEVAYILGIGAAGVLVMNGLGYLRILFSWDENDLVKHFTRMIVALLLAYIVRTAWWDIGPYWMGAELWRSLSEGVGGRSVNAIFHLMAIYAGVHGLFALRHMIPEEERSGWFWFDAWLYPPWKMTREFRRCMTRAARILFGKGRP